MPFTPFHFGHALPFGFIDWKKNRVDLVAALTGSVVVDTRAFFIFVFNLGGALHGLLHCFLSALILGILIGVFLELTQSFYNPWLKKIQLEQHSTLMGKIGIATLMAFTHVFLDAIIYPEMHPFQPFIEGNPFFGWLSQSTVYSICIYGFLISFAQIIGYYIYRNTKGAENTLEDQTSQEAQQDYQDRFVQNISKKNPDESL
ncbi:MAG: hypothetical protein ACTSRK_14125 [Promethearchaeota archaeon]